MRSYAHSIHPKLMVMMIYLLKCLRRLLWPSPLLWLNYLISLYHLGNYQKSGKLLVLHLFPNHVITPLMKNIAVSAEQTPRNAYSKPTNWPSWKILSSLCSSVGFTQGKSMHNWCPVRCNWSKAQTAWLGPRYLLCVLWLQQSFWFSSPQAPSAKALTYVHI